MCELQKMDLITKKRGENWSSEEKEILRHLISESSQILENKSTKSNLNLQKAREWKKVTIQFNEITAKNRSEAELKLSWTRMKLSAKANISAYNREQSRTGGGGKPPSPSQEDLEVMAIAPHDFEVENNDYDSDALLNITHNYEESIAGPSREHPTNPIDPTNCIEIETPEIQQNTTDKRDSKKRKEQCTKQDIIESNVYFKKRNLEMLEIEHNYNIEIAKLKIKKLKSEIDILEIKKKQSNE